MSDDAHIVLQFARSEKLDIKHPFESKTHLKNS